MKLQRISLFAVLLAAAASLQAQPILNKGFENWNSNSGYPLPDNWWAMGGTITQASNAFGGSSAVKMQGFLGCGISPGILVSGAQPAQWDYLHSGTPCSFKPSAITGHYMFGGGGANDSAEVTVILKKYNTILQRHDTIAFGQITLGPASFYTPFTVNITDLRSGVNPDSMVIILNSSKHNTWDTVNYLMPEFQVDELRIMDELSGIAEAPALLKTSIQPNPFSSQARLVLHGDGRALDELTLKVTDVTGKEVLKLENITGNTVHIDRNNMPAGIYFYRFDNGSFAIGSGKMVVQ